MVILSPILKHCQQQKTASIILIGANSKINININININIYSNFASNSLILIPTLSPTAQFTITTTLINRNEGDINLKNINITCWCISWLMTG